MSKAADHWFCISMSKAGSRCRCSFTSKQQSSRLMCLLLKEMLVDEAACIHFTRKRMNVRKDQ